LALGYKSDSNSKSSFTKIFGQSVVTTFENVRDEMPEVRVKNA